MLIRDLGIFCKTFQHFFTFFLTHCGIGNFPVCRLIVVAFSDNLAAESSRDNSSFHNLGPLCNVFNVLATSLATCIGCKLGQQLTLPALVTTLATMCCHLHCHIGIELLSSHNFFIWGNLLLYK